MTKTWDEVENMRPYPLPSERSTIRVLTPYEKHAGLGHAPMSRYSPNSVDIIEECDCGARFLHNPSFGYPVTLYR